jgi:hypothetical protein
MDNRVIPLVSCLLASACAPTIQGAARQASRAAVDESVEQLTSEGAKTELKEAAHDPDVESATKEIADQIADGLLVSLNSERSREQIAGLTKTLTEAAVQQFIASLGTSRNRAQLEQLTTGMTRAAMAQVAVSLREDLGPAFETLIKDDVVPGMTSALDSQLQPALGQSAQLVAYNAVLGANRGIDEAFLGEGKLLDDFRAGVSQSLPQWVWFIGAVVGLFALAMLSLAVLAIARARKAHTDLERLEKATLLLATATREKQIQSDEILAIVQDALAKHGQEGSGPFRRAAS